MTSAPAAGGVEALPPRQIAINAWFWGQLHVGSGQYLHDLLHHLSEGYPHDDYVLLLPAGRGESNGSALPHGNLHRIPLSTPFDAVHGNAAKVWFEQVSVPRACRRLGVELLHVPYWGPPLRAPVPVATTVHDVIPAVLPAYRGGLGVRLYTALARRAARRSAVVITDSHTSAADVRRVLDVPMDRILVAPLGVGDPFHPIVDPNEAGRERVRLALPAHYFLYLGGFDRRKNVGLLLRGYAELVGRRPDAPPLVIAGRLPDTGSPLFEDVRRSAADVGVQDKVLFLGAVREEDKPALYALALCFVFPSRYEGFGLPVLEAMACGTPAVVLRGTACAEVAGEGGIAVEEEPAALAAAMETLWQDAGRRKALAEAASKRASTFRWEQTAWQTRLGYERAISSVSQQSSQKQGVSL